MNSKQEEMLAKFRRFLNETPKEELQAKIEKIKQMNFTGESVEEYFANFHEKFIINPTMQTSYLVSMLVPDNYGGTFVYGVHDFQPKEFDEESEAIQWISQQPFGLYYITKIYNMNKINTNEPKD